LSVCGNRLYQVLRWRLWRTNLLCISIIDISLLASVFLHHMLKNQYKIGTHLLIVIRCTRLRYVCRNPRTIPVSLPWVVAVWLSGISGMRSLDNYFNEAARAPTVGGRNNRATRDPGPSGGCVMGVMGVMGVEALAAGVVAAAITHHAPLQASAILHPTVDRRDLEPALCVVSCHPGSLKDSRGISCVLHCASASCNHISCLSIIICCAASPTYPLLPT
jgi:hypothetical protein